MNEKKTHEEIVRQVKEIVAEVLKKTPADIIDDADFIDIGADSLDRMTLIVMLEDTMKCAISDTEAKTLTNVTTVVNFIESKQ